jgi:WD40 repeat protein
MDTIKNTHRTKGRISLMIGLAGVAMIVLKVTGFVPEREGGGLLLGFGIIVAIFGLAMAAGNLVSARRVDEIKAGKDILAYWRFSQEEWAAFLSTEKYGFPLVGVLLTIFFSIVLGPLVVGLFDAFDAPGVLSASIVVAVAALIILWMILKRKKVRGTPTSVFLTSAGALHMNVYKSWTGDTTRLKRIELITEPSRSMQFVCESKGKRGWTEFKFHVPIPVGKTMEAQRVADLILAKYNLSPRKAVVDAPTDTTSEQTTAAALTNAGMSPEQAGQYLTQHPEEMQTLARAAEAALSTGEEAQVQDAVSPQDTVAPEGNPVADSAAVPENPVRPHVERDDAFTRMKQRSIHQQAEGPIEIAPPIDGRRRRLWPILLMIIVVAALGFGVYSIRGVFSDPPGLVHTLDGHGGGIWKLQYSSDGRYIASACGGYSEGDLTVKIWDAGSGKLLHTLQPDGGEVLELAFSKNGNLLAIVAVESIRMVRVPSGEEFSRFRGDETGGESEFTLSPDACYASSLDWGYSLWNTVTGKMVGECIPSQNEQLKAKSFAPDGSLLACIRSYDTLRVFRMTPGDIALIFEKVLEPEYDGIYAVEFSHDGRSILYKGENKILVIDLATGAEKLKIAGRFDRSRLFHFSADDKRIFYQEEPDWFCVREIAGGNETARIKLDFESGNMPFYYLAPDEQTFVLDDIGSERCEVWSIAQGKMLRALVHRDSFFQFRSHVNLAAISPDGIHVATAHDKIRIWKIDAGR